MTWTIGLAIGLSAGQSTSSAPTSAPATAPATAPTSTSAPSTGPASQASTQAASQPTSLPADGREVTAEAVQAMIQRLEQNTSIAPASRKSALEQCGQALEQVRFAQEESAKIDAFKRTTEGAPAQLEEFRAKLQAQTQPTTAESAPSSEIPLAELEQMARQASAKRFAIQRELRNLEDQPKRILDRRTESPKVMAQFRTQLDEIDRELGLSAPAQEEAEVTAARRMLLEARRQLITRQSQAFRAETRSYTATADLLTARTGYVTRQAQRVSDHAKTLQTLLSQRRKGEADRLADEARQALANVGNSHPLLLRLATENLDLALGRTGPDGLTALIEQATSRSSQIRRDLTGVNSDFEGMRERIEAAGLNNAIGLFLRKQRASLPEVSQLQQDIRARREESSRIQLRSMELRDERKALNDTSAEAAGLVSKVTDLDPAQRQDLQWNVEALLQKRQGYLDSLIKDCDTYFNLLMNLDASSHRLIEAVQRNSQYVDERVLWIQSAPPLYKMRPSGLAEAMAWLGDPSLWTDTGRAILRSATNDPIPWVASIIALLVLLRLKRRFLAQLWIEKDLPPEQVNAFSNICRSSFVALINVALLAAALWLLAAVVERAQPTTELARALAGALAGALRALAVGQLALAVLVQSCRGQGILRTHFHWPQRSVFLLRRRLFILAFITLPILLLVALMESQSVESRKDTLGRLAFIADMLVLAGFITTSLRPTGQILGEVMARSTTGILRRFRGMWFALAVAIPLILAAVAVVGYYYTAVQLAWRCLASVWLAVMLVLLLATVQRWMLVTRLVLTGRKVPQVHKALPAVALGASDLPAVAAPDPDEGLLTMRKQTRRFLQYVMIVALLVGLWLIWAQMVPALGALKRVQLWTYAGTAAAGGTARQIPVTLADLLLAGGVFLLTFAAARNIPGLLRIALLRQLNLSDGGTYAITAVTRYVVVVVGVVLAFGLIGVGWSSVQWLVAAMTVGLGFGLQEIFANFVSGLIILFERPIRIGDVVTVGEVTGVVSRIRTRATVIVNLDHKELIIPNKAFITGQVMNWTLSDTVLRLVIPVSVAANSDLDKTQALLLELAKACPLVLKDPPPRAILVGLTAPAASFELRAFTSGMDDFHQARHELLRVIGHSFEQAGITRV